MQRETTLELINLTSPRFWKFRVRSKNHLGVASEWVEYEKEIIGLSDRPQDPVSLSAVAVNGMAYLSWPASVDMDVLFGGEVKIRIQQSGNETATPAWTQSFTLNIVPGNNVTANVPLMTGFYAIKFIDSQGNESLNAAYAYLQQVSSVTYTTEYSIREETDFSGTKYDCNVNVSNQLELDTVGGIVEPEGVYEFDLTAYSGLFDSATKFDSATLFDASTVYLSGGGTRRITAVIDYEVVNISDLFDSHTGLFDSGLDFDDISGSEGDGWIEYRKTDDDPELSDASWTEWQRIDAGEVSYTGLALRSQLRSYEPQGQVRIASLGVNIEAPV